MNLFLTSAFGFSDNASEKGRCVYHSLRKEGIKEHRKKGEHKASHHTNNAEKKNQLSV